MGKSVCDISELWFAFLSCFDFLGAETAESQLRGFDYDVLYDQMLDVQNEAFQLHKGLVELGVGDPKYLRWCKGFVC